MADWIAEQHDNPFGYSQPVLEDIKSGNTAEGAIKKQAQKEGRIALKKQQEADLLKARNNYQQGKGYDKNFNTILDNVEEGEFQKWRNTLPSHLQSDKDYDLRGKWKYDRYSDDEGRGIDGMHFPDTWKKPNHRTYSSLSIYNSAEHPGGEIDQMYENPQTGERKAIRPFMGESAPQGWKLVAENYINPRDRILRDAEYQQKDQQKTNQKNQQTGKVFGNNIGNFWDKVKEFVMKPGQWKDDGDVSTPGTFGMGSQSTKPPEMD